MGIRRNDDKKTENLKIIFIEESFLHKIILNIIWKEIRKNDDTEA